jgi:hypothetical protein
MFKFINYFIKIFNLLGIIILLNSCEFKNHSKELKKNYQSQQQFIKGSQDIPLIDGLILIDDEDIEFDTILGGFDSSSYLANISTEIISQFYLNNLPKLGWNLQKNSGNQIIFSRENQKLSIKFYFENEKKMVNFSLTTAQE